MSKASTDDALVYITSARYVIFGTHQTSSNLNLTIFSCQFNTMSSSTLQVQAPASNQQTPLRSLLVSVSIASQSEAVRLILKDAVLFAIHSGATVALAWDQQQKALISVNAPTGVAYVVPALSYGVAQNFLEPLLNMIAQKHGGSIEQPKLEGWKKCIDIACDIIIGAGNVGGAHAILAEIKDPEQVDVIVTFILCFFSYWVMKLLVKTALLNISYKKTIARPGIEWKEYYRRSMGDALKSLISLHQIVTNLTPRVVAFSIYPLLANVITAWWTEKHGTTHPGIPVLINLLWFFVDFDTCFEMAARIADCLLPSERVVEAAEDQQDA
ncbi:hypothetical protein [Ochrobactrum sp. BTU1]|jgi:hypothetical protein|uniref:hypothetical protein n=1 Tax=Ochrobactrum sp. BTU1 TaxID=2840456 RepID=UPI001C03F9AE|nr:hypothetical protein KMS41_23335 [Ochrobactrum sp. BTU1]